LPSLLLSLFSSQKYPSEVGGLEGGAGDRRRPPNHV
jgi:hypothetical protein